MFRSLLQRCENSQKTTNFDQSNQDPSIQKQFRSLREKVDDFHEPQLSDAKMN